MAAGSGNDIVLVHTIATYADCTDKNTITVKAKRTRENGDPIREIRIQLERLVYCDQAWIAVIAVQTGIHFLLPVKRALQIAVDARWVIALGKEIEVGPPEDLMREHGVLKRVLLIYGEALRRLDAKQDFPPDALANAAGIIRSFVEDYHEKLEEDFLFPRFEKANQLVDLVKVLRTQHQAGRRVTDITLRLANLQSLKNDSERAQLIASMQQFIRMYNPHEAREDTILFPAFHKIVSPHEFDSLGEDFEKKEDELFGEDGFEKVVDKVAGIEKRLGIYDLAQFTPKI